MKKEIHDIIIVGAGIIGAAVARELSRYKLDILVLEANASYGQETTTGNSGLIHGGFDATPGKLNAKLNQIGKHIYYNDWFKKLDFNHQKVNSLVLAFNEIEENHLEVLRMRGKENGCSDDELKIINKEEVISLQPNLSQEVSKALLCTSSSVVNPVELTGVLLRNAKKNNCQVKFSEKVIKIIRQVNYFKISTTSHIYKTKVIINCAGHYADVVSKMAGYDDFDTYTRRGEYIILKPSKKNYVENVLFMVPTIHGKGVIVAPTLDGCILVGPTSEENIEKDETRLITNVMFERIVSIGKHIIPTLDFEKVCYRYAGSRPIYKKTDDFYIEYASDDNNFINVAGIKSPGISAAPAIAEYVAEMVKSVLSLEEKSDWDPYQKDIMYE